jgi:hypothetical protein
MRKPGRGPGNQRIHPDFGVYPHFIPEFLYPIDDKIVWSRIPKNASTSMVHSMIPRLDSDGYVPKDMIDLENKFIFCVCRNPYDRLVSAWRNRLHEMRVSWNENFVGLSFPQFVLRLEDMDHKDMDYHFRPQYTFVQHLDIDYVARFETVQKDWDYLSTLSDRFGPLKHDKRSRRKKDWREYYTPELIQIVQRVFARDFEIFEYSKDIS